LPTTLLKSNFIYRVLRAEYTVYEKKPLGGFRNSFVRAWVIEINRPHILQKMSDALLQHLSGTSTTSYRLA
jgi:hypothetical protein